MDLSSRKTWRVSSGYGKSTCAWIHPDKKKILYSSTHLDPLTRKKQKEEFKLRSSGKIRHYAWDFDEHFDIFAKDFSNGRLKNLTKAKGYDAEAAYSPDGRRIVFASNRHAYIEKLTVESMRYLKKIVLI